MQIFVAGACVFIAGKTFLASLPLRLPSSPALLPCSLGEGPSLLPSQLANSRAEYDSPPSQGRPRESPRGEGGGGRGRGLTGRRARGRGGCGRRGARG